MPFHNPLKVITAFCGSAAAAVWMAGGDKRAASTVVMANQSKDSFFLLLAVLLDNILSWISDLVSRPRPARTTFRVLLYVSNIGL
jgi:hypothetical protein